MKTTRPTNLSLSDLRTIKLPITAISSLLHRISGIILFLSIPVLLWLLARTLSVDSDYQELLTTLTMPWMKFIIWSILSALSFHIIAGIRHLFMDMGFGETLEVGKLTATLTLVVAVIVAATWGAWLW